MPTTWDDIIINQDFVGGDIQWVEEESGAMYRGPIDKISESEGGRLIEFTLSWCAHLHLPGSWHIAHAKASIGFSKEEATLKPLPNGCIEFEVPHFAGGILYPRGKNLDLKEVKGSVYTGSLLH